MNRVRAWARAAQRAPGWGWSLASSFGAPLASALASAIGSSFGGGFGAWRPGHQQICGGPATQIGGSSAGLRPHLEEHEGVFAEAGRPSGTVDGADVFARRPGPCPGQLHSPAHLFCSLKGNSLARWRQRPLDGSGANHASQQLGRPAGRFWPSASEHVSPKSSSRRVSSQELHLGRASFGALQPGQWTRRPSNGSKSTLPSGRRSRRAQAVFL